MRKMTRCEGFEKGNTQVTGRDLTKKKESKNAKEQELSRGWNISCRLESRGSAYTSCAREGFLHYICARQKERICMQDSLEIND